MQPAKPDAPPPGVALAGKLNSSQMPMVTLAKLLSRMQRDTVLDMTGLKGLFEVHLEWAYEPPARAREGTEPPAGPSLQDALQQQLGLRVESLKGPVDVLVVDSASKAPVRNCTRARIGRGESFRA